MPSSPNIYDHMPIPTAGTPLFVDSSGVPDTSWYLFWMYLWKKLGWSIQGIGETILLRLVGSVPTMYLASAPDDPIGQIISGTTPGAPEVPLTPDPGASPWFFSATTSGVLVVSHGEVALQRPPSSNWWVAGVVGGAPSLRKADRARVTWPRAVAIGEGMAPFIESAGAPIVTWFPDT